jgi:hypothetical protein
VIVRKSGKTRTWTLKAGREASNPGQFSREKEDAFLFPLLISVTTSLLKQFDLTHTFFTTGTEGLG